MLPPLFRLAKSVSKHSNHQIKVGAVLVKNSHPIATGYNKIRYDREWGNVWNKSIHAECHVMKLSKRDYIRGCTIYVYREKADGSIGLARPCLDCLKKLRIFGVKEIVYSIDTFPFWKSEKLNA
jgi:deoxycytidylate deaminase